MKNQLTNDFLRTWDKTDEYIQATLHIAETIRHRFENNISSRVFDTGVALSIFRDQSTRTRHSFFTGANLLGLAVEDFDEKKSQVAHGETLLETVNMLGFLTRVVGIRDDIYLGVAHAEMVESAEALDWGEKEGVLSKRPSIINLQSDEDHPTQSLSDILHLSDVYGGLENLKGKHVTMSWAYSPSYGKPMSVPQGFIALASRFGMKITLCYPKGYHLIPEIEKLSQKQAVQSGGSFRITHDMNDAFTGADIVYPKSWASFEVMEKRTELLKKSDSEGLKTLEKTALTQNKHFSSWTCTGDLMKRTKKGSALYMHCLPADVSGESCKHGEVEAGVFRRYRVQTFRQASWKPYVIAAMILSCQFGDKVSTMLPRLLHWKK